MIGSFITSNKNTLKELSVSVTTYQNTIKELIDLGLYETIYIKHYVEFTKFYNEHSYRHPSGALYVWLIERIYNI